MQKGTIIALLLGVCLFDGQLSTAGYLDDDVPLVEQQLIKEADRLTKVLAAQEEEEEVKEELSPRALATWLKTIISHKLTVLVKRETQENHMPWTLGPRIKRLSRSLSDLEKALSEEDDA